ncbi:MAG: SPOR domain-containing protein [Pseudomonadota bacterium]
MRPDLEDYTDMDEAPTSERSRAMSWMVLAVAVGGFAALAYYAYHSGTQTAGPGELVTVEADGSPIREVPQDPEGEQFPNKDKTIYDVIAPSDADKQAEKLLPDAEHPVAAADTEDSENSPNAATTFVASPDAKKVDPVDAAVTPVPSLAAPVTPAPTVVAQTPAPVAAPAVAPVKVAPKSFSAPEMINEKPAPVVVKKEAEPKAVEKPKAAPVKAVATAATGPSTIQLGAFKSEEEAQAAWKKISGKFSDTINGAPTIVKADVNGSTFYRLRTTVANAKAACAALSGKGQACMPVK